MWDQRRLERAMANLLSNAIKYSPEGGEITASNAIGRVSGVGIGLASARQVVEQNVAGGGTAEGHRHG